MKALVIGGCGYIGSGLVYKLLEQRYEVEVIDNLSSGHINSIPFNVKLYRFDVSNLYNLENIIKGYDVVFHLAENSSVQDSVNNPEKYIVENVRNTLNVIDTCIKNNIRKFVYSSSAAVYREHNNIITENTPKYPVSPYGKAKLYIDELLVELSKKNKIDGYSLRYFNACGADHNGRYGEKHEPETHIIPNLIKASIKNESVNIYGNDYSTKDGTTIRDYVHIDDINNAHFNIINSDPGSYNIGTNKGYSLIDLILKVEEISGKKLDINYLDRRSGDPKSLVADYEKINKAIEWYPQNDLNDIIKSAYNFHTKYS